MRKTAIFYFSILAILVSTASIAVSQTRPPLPRASSKASVMQVIGTTEVTISYGRPGVKGRTVWGEWPEKVEGEQTLDDGRVRPPGAPLVPYGHIWRAGANEATLFTVNDDVLINGELLPAGRYSFHAIPGKEEWTLIFNKDEGQWGSFSYDKSKDALRVKTKPQMLTDSKEWLTFGFEVTSDDAANAYLRWEKVKVPFSVKVKDVVGSTIKRLKTFAETAGANDAGPWMTAAGYARNNKQADQAKAWFEKANTLNEESIAKGATFQNLSRKGNILLGLDKRADAISAFEAALAKGKADKVRASDLEALEKRIADLKAAK